MRYWKDWLKGEKEMSLCSLGLSCEPINDDLTCCKHLVHVSLPCEFCKLQKQIDALSIQVAQQLEFKLRQIDENRNVSRRLNEIENGLIKRIGILGTALHELSEENHKLKNVPHKCPVCDGFGGTKISGTIDEECNSCDGKGIVWG